MKKLLFLAILAPALSQAQVRVGATAGFTLDLPVVIPQLVVVSPGIQVVPGIEYEVFHADGVYWTRRDDGWYRSGNPRSGWVFAPRGVPPGLSRMPPGKYRHWRPEGPPPGRPGYGPPPGAAARGGGAARAAPPPPPFREERGARFEDHGRGRGHEDRRHDDRGRGHDEGHGERHGHDRHD